MIRRNYDKFFQGFKTKVLAKITTLTSIQFLNIFVFNRNINNLKKISFDNAQRVNIINGFKKYNQILSVSIFLAKEKIL